MAYRLGDVIAASDLNGFLAQARALYGVGVGDRGYGQTAIAQPDVVVGDLILSSHWTNLRAMVDVAVRHQGTSAALLPPVSELAVGEIVEAHEDETPTLDPFDLPEVLAAADAARLVAAPSSTALVFGREVTRADPWGGAPELEPYVAANRHSIVAEITATWPSEDAARHFFNSGGTLRLTLSHPSGGGPKDIRWRAGLADRVGMLELAARETRRSGAADPRGILFGETGFYTLADEWTPMFDGRNTISGFGIGWGGYYVGTEPGYTPGRVNDVYVWARRGGYAGERGGNGTSVTLIVWLRDEVLGGPAGDDILLPGTRATVDVRRAVAPLMNIAPPVLTDTGFVDGSAINPGAGTYAPGGGPPPP